MAVIVQETWADHFNPVLVTVVDGVVVTVAFNDVFVRHRYHRKLCPKNVAIVESLLFNMPVLLLDGVELAPL